MAIEDIYVECEELYQNLEEQYGIYLHMELDLSYVWHYIEKYLAAGVGPEEVIESARAMIIGAADDAAMVQAGDNCE